jgi:hypothetical protein
MADNSLAASLRRLFSTNVIVRKSPSGSGLKVRDTSKLQAFNQDYLKDKFYRIHRSSLTFNSKDQITGYSAMREQLYRDYDIMDSDPIIASALDIYADESTTRDESGNILKIYSSDDNIKQILENLYYDVLNIDFNLWPWVRNLAKYGDFFLHLDISEKYGIVNVKPLSCHEIERIEDSDPANPYYVKFENLLEKNVTYENYEMAHFRLLSDSNFIPYGKSMVENARRIHKQLQLMEDAMLIHRIMRAPSKRVFKIDIGNIPPAEVENYMQQVINKMKKEPHIDRTTGDYNLKYNIQNMTEDFYLPTRGNNSNTEISELGGLSYDGTDDIEYLKNKMLSALKIPKAYLGYEEALSGKATLAQEDIRFARTIDRIQRIIESELTKIAIIHLYAQGYGDDELVNFTIKLNNPSTIYTREKIELLSSKIGLIRDIKSEKMLSQDWIYENILDLTDDEIEKEREKILEDMKSVYRLNTIESEGRDPEKEPQQGTPDGDTTDEPDYTSGSQFDDGYGDIPPLVDSDVDPSDSHSIDKSYYSKNDFSNYGKMGGRPKDVSRYGKDDYVMGRDPLGRVERTRNESILDKLNLPKKNNKKMNLLSEDNILEDSE